MFEIIKNQLAKFNFFSTPTPPPENIAPKIPEKNDTPEIPAEIFKNVIRFLPNEEVIPLKGLSKTAYAMAQDQLDGQFLFKAFGENTNTPRLEVLRMADNPHTLHNNRSLDMAIAKGDKELVKLLLNNPIIDPSHDDQSALTIALQMKDFDMVALLLTNYKVDASKIPSWAIHSMVENGNSESLEFLVKENKIDLTADNNQLLKLCAEKGLFKVVELLIEDPRVKPNIDDNKIYQLASAANNPKIIQHLLNNLKVDPQSTTPDNVQQDRINQTIQTILGIALISESFSVVKTIIQDGRYNPNLNEVFVNPLNGIPQALNLDAMLILHGDLELLHLWTGNPNLNPQLDQWVNTAIFNNKVESLKYLMETFNHPATFINLHLSVRRGKENIETTKYLLNQEGLTLSNLEKAVIFNAKDMDSEIKTLLKENFWPLNSNTSTFKHLCQRLYFNEGIQIIASLSALAFLSYKTYYQLENSAYVPDSYKIYDINSERSPALEFSAFIISAIAIKAWQAALKPINYVVAAL